MEIKARNAGPRIGLYSAGLHAYWAQFSGLYDRLMDYNAFIERRLSQWGEVYNRGIVDTEAAGRAAGDYFAEHNVDIVFAHSATYFTSSVVLPIHQRCAAPAVFLNLQPAQAMDYARTDTGEWLAQCVGCPMPEAANALERAGIPFHMVSGLLGLDHSPAIARADEDTHADPRALRASLLTAEGVPCAGEGDIKTNVAMKICDLLGRGGSFAEIVAMDYARGTMLIGHDGPFHISIAQGKPILRGMGVFHGKRGSGVSVEARVRPGPVTLLGLTQLRDGSLRLIASEGMAVAHPILAIGNTQTHIDFGMDLDAYMDEWFACAPTHHCAISVGHNAALFARVAALLGIPCVRVGKEGGKA